MTTAAGHQPLTIKRKPQLIAPIWRNINGVGILPVIMTDLTAADICFSKNLFFFGCRASLLIRFGKVTIETAFFIVMRVGVFELVLFDVTRFT